MNERPKSDAENAEYTYAKLDDIPETRPQDILRVEAVCSAQVDEVGEGEVEVDVLETKERGEQNSRAEECRLLAGQDNREDQDPIQESVVLEMDVVDNEKTRREEDGETGHMCSLLVRHRSRFDESKDTRR